MPTVLIYHDLPIEEALGGQRDDLAVEAAATREAAIEKLPDAAIFVTNPRSWDDAFLDGLAAGNWIQATSAGYDAFPIEAFEERGVVFSNAGGNYGPPVSEHVFALAFAHSRKLPTFFERQDHSTWSREVGATTTDWEGKTLTVYGIGDIGEDVARRGLGFDFDVYGVKRDPADYDGCLAADRIVGPDEFHAVLSETELLVATVPLTDETRHSLDSAVFRALPDSAFVVNVARGPVIDESALLDAVTTGEIAGAGLDVFADEPLPADSPLWDAPGVIITPHVGGRSDRFVSRFAALFLSNYDRRRAGDPLENRIV